MISFDSITPCRLLVDGPASGAWQMAVDEVLLDSAAERGVATLRFYEWSEPTLSLGYFQGYRERDAHRASRDCPLVRRQTGGGAILHDVELTYSLALPFAHPLAADTTRLYDAAHQALIEVLAGFDIVARLCEQASAIESGEQPFLCFARRSTGDVLLGNSKIGGSAQRRRRGAILQHGSLILAASPAAPELPGIFELAKKKLSPVALTEAWAKQMAGQLWLRPTASFLTAGELDAIRKLTLEKYSANSWNQRR